MPAMGPLMRRGALEKLKNFRHWNWQETGVHLPRQRCAGISYPENGVACLYAVPIPEWN